MNKRKGNGGEGMMEYWNNVRAKTNSREGRALSRPATTKRGPPKACIPPFHHFNIPIKVFLP